MEQVFGIEISHTGQKTQCLLMMLGQWIHSQHLHVHSLARDSLGYCLRY